MKKFKRIMALVIALAMVLTMMSMTAFASENSTTDVSGSITVQNPQKTGETASTYTAYKIFDVTYEDGDSGKTDLYAYTITDAVGTSNEWADVIIDTANANDDGSYPTKLKDKDGNVIGGIKFVPLTALDVKSGETVTQRTYQVIADDTFSAPEFAKALQKTSPMPDGGVTLSGTTPKAEGLDLGYYFVTTTTGTLCNLTTTHPDELIYDKNEVPSVDKSILEDTDNNAQTPDAEIKNNNAAIGDYVHFQIDTKVPSMVGYDSYYFIVKDTLSPGLDFVDPATSTDLASKTIDVAIAAGEEAANHPAITLTRIYLNPADGAYYKTATYNATTKVWTYSDKITKPVRDSEGNITTEGTNAPQGFDDDDNIKNCYYVTYEEVNADTTTDVLSNTDGTTRPDTVKKGETRVKFVFVDMIQYLDKTVGNTANLDQTEEGTLGSSDTTKGYTGSAITIKYYGQVDEDAVVGEEGNPNTAKVTYSNDPTQDGNGEKTPDEPGPDTPTGDSVDSTTKTFITGIQLEKIDGDDTSKKLANAKFTIKANNLLNTVIENGVKYEENIGGTTYVPKTYQDTESGIKFAIEKLADNKTYYLLKDGTYTSTAPVTSGSGDNSNLYADTSKTYSKVEYAWVIEKPETVADDTYTAITDSDGHLYFAGLKAGDYTLTEVIAPDGYNLLTKPITITVSAKYVDDQGNEITGEDIDKIAAAKCVWSAKDGDNNELTLVNMTSGEKEAEAEKVNQVLQITVKNNKGTVLPSTGGIGTTIFYVLGAILVIGAGVVLITRRRMEA